MRCDIGNNRGPARIVSGLFSAILLAWAATASGVDYPGPEPGKADLKWEGPTLTLRNQAISAVWKAEGDRVRLVSIADRAAGVETPGSDGLFRLTLADGRILRASEMRIEKKDDVERLPADPHALRQADRCEGAAATIAFRSSDGAISADWRVSLRDGANYFRVELTVRANSPGVNVRDVTLLDLPLEKAALAGSVDGSPVVAGNLFLACEHPMAANRVETGRAIASVGLFRPLAPGESCVRSAVVGVAPAGQLRRAYLYYLERQRPRPYQPFLHYNSWYDIAWGDRKMTEPQCLAVIDLFRRELVENRAVRLDSVVFDDGWDDNRTLWRFHGGFPRGFTPLTEAATRAKSAVGVWLSPWGGYGQAQRERLQYGRTQGFETNGRGFSLAGPKYYERFRDVCREMIERFGVNYFKFDGIAQGLSSAGAGPEFAGDVDALLRLTADLRTLRPDLFVNITTGTWPSPYWLFWGDSIWRNGNDMGFHGPGSRRQQWITYRDALTYQGIVRRGPLFPLNSLMTQGICHARLGTAANLGADQGDWQAEVRSFFGSGTQLQELYVTPELLTPDMWNALADGARWSRENADVLADSHWIGGDPAQGQVYGFASWSPRRGLLVLRNPAPTAAEYTLDLAPTFELPAGAPRGYLLTACWPNPAATPPLVLTAGAPHRLTLGPFEVLVLMAVPGKGAGGTP